MKTITLLEKKGDLVNRHPFHARESDIFTLLVDLSDSTSIFSVELADGETLTGYGLTIAESELHINQPATLKSEGAEFSLNFKNAGLHFFQLDLSDKINPVLRFQEEAHEVQGQGSGLDHFLNSKLPVTFEIGNTDMLIHDVLSLNTGSVIELNRLVGQALDIYVGEEMVAKGEVVVMPDSTFGARVIKVMPIAGQMSKRFALENGEQQ
jgi:flagellar motor switch protein FliN